MELYSLVGDQLLTGFGGVYALDLGSVSTTLESVGIKKGLQMFWILEMFKKIFEAEINWRGVEIGEDGKPIK